MLTPLELLYTLNRLSFLPFHYCIIYAT